MFLLRKQQTLIILSLIIANVVYQMITSTRSFLYLRIITIFFTMMLVGITLKYTQKHIQQLINIIILGLLILVQVFQVQVTLNFYSTLTLLIFVVIIIQENHSQKQIFLLVIMFQLTALIIIIMVYDIDLGQLFLLILIQPLYTLLFQQQLNHRQRKSKKKFSRQKTENNLQSENLSKDQGKNLGLIKVERHDNAQFLFQPSLVSEENNNLKEERLTIDHLIQELPFGIVLMDKSFNILHNNKLILNFLKCSNQQNLLTKINEIAQKFKNEQLGRKYENPKLSISINLSQGKKNLNQEIVQKTNLKMPLQEQNNDQDKLYENLKFMFSKENLQYIFFLYKCSRIHTFSCKNIKQTKLNYQDVFDSQTLDFKIRFINSQTQNFNQKDQVNFYIISMENITKTKQIKNIKNKFFFQSLLINSYSHELLTPINGSIQLLQCLEEELTDKQKKNYFMPALVSNKKLFYQIRDIIDFGLIEQENFRLTIKPFSFIQIQQEIRYLFDQECVEKQISIQFITADKNLEQIQIFNDYTRIMQVMINLINNSLKFTQQGGKIQIMIEYNKQLQGYIISLQDNGQGIHLEQLQNIEQSLKNQKQESYENEIFTGVSLRISNLISIQLYQSSEGYLKIESAQFQYTKSSFIISDNQQNKCRKPIGNFERYFEKYKIIQSEQQITISQDIPQKINGQKSKNFLETFKKIQCKCNQILIVDDVPFNHLALKNVLKKFNLLADSAFDGLQAVKMVQMREQTPCQICILNYKLILMDFEMPRLDGFQTTIQIFELIKKKKDLTNIVLCSAYSGQDMMDKAYEIGMSAILPKPILAGELKKILKEFLIY